jgi:hypothetical protein
MPIQQAKEINRGKKYPTKECIRQQNSKRQYKTLDNKHKKVRGGISREKQGSTNVDHQQPPQLENEKRKTG